MDGLLLGAQEPQEPEQSPHAAKRKRIRYSTACLPCQRRKTKCDTNAPCDACTQRGSAGQCEYGIVKFKDASVAQLEYADLKTRVLKLEDIVRHLQARLPDSAASSSLLPSQPFRDLQEARADAEPFEPPSRDERTFENDTEAAALLLEAKAIGREQYGLLGATSSVIHGNAHQQSVPVETPSTSRLEYLLSPGSLLGSLPSDKNAGSYTSIVLQVNLSDVRLAKRRQEVQSLLAVLPAQNVCEFLLEEYFADIDWVYKVVHRGLFEHELSQFWINTSDSTFDPAFLDPAWLALLLCMLSWSVSTDLVKQHLRSRFGMQAEEVENIGEDWSMAVQKALVLANWTGRPQFRVLQTLGLLMNLQGSASVHPGFGNTAFQVWLPAAIRIAQALNVDRHEPPSSNWLDDDPALPKGLCDLKIELCNRVWTLLWCSDLIFSSASKATLVYQPEWLEHAPAYANDRDFSQALAWQLMRRHNTDAAVNENTFHWVRVELAHFQRAVNDFLRKERRTYAMVKDLDAVLQKSIAGLPTLLPSSNAGCKAYHTSVATCVLHNRLLRLHRPFLLRGLSDSKYQYSMQQCTKSARTLCQALTAIVQAHRLDAFWYMLGQALGAVIVIFIETFHKIWTAQPTLPADLEPSIGYARELFEEGKRSVSPTISKVARQGLRVIEVLSQMESDPILRPPGSGVFGDKLSSIFRRTALLLEERHEHATGIHQQEDIAVPTYGMSADPSSNTAATEAYIPYLLDSDYLLASANGAFANSGFGVDWSQILTDSALFE